VVVERITLLNGPRFHVFVHQSERFEVSHVNVTVDRSYQRRLKAGLRAARVAALTTAGVLSAAELAGMVLQPEDLNTDGIDVSGVGGWVHDCAVLNDDDSVSVKPSKVSDVVGADGRRSNCSENILVERTTMAGFGASVGAVAPKSTLNRACVRNVTFRDIHMPRTGKGIYIKSNPGCDDGGDGSRNGNHGAGSSDDDGAGRGGKIGLIEDVVYENVRIDRPSWWAIWIGPQQQHEPGSDLGDLCSLAFPWVAHCPVPACVTVRRVVLRNVTITTPLLSPGVVLGSEFNPVQGLEFDSVVVVRDGGGDSGGGGGGDGGGGGEKPFGFQYLCENADATSSASTPRLRCGDARRHTSSTAAAAASPSLQL